MLITLWLENFNNMNDLLNITMSQQALKFSMNMPDNLHKKLKVEAAQKGTTVTDILIGLIEKHQKSKSK